MGHARKMGESRTDKFPRKNLNLSRSDRNAASDPSSKERFNFGSSRICLKVCMFSPSILHERAFSVHTSTFWSQDTTPNPLV
eukprot:20792_5